MSDFVEKDNKKERKFLEEIRKDIEAERINDQSLGLLLDKSIEAQNKIWLIKNKNAIVDLPDKEVEQSALNYIVFKKSEEFLSNKVPADAESIIEDFIGLLIEKYNNIKESDLNNPNDGEIKVQIDGKEETINAFAGIENYIVNVDPSYTKTIEDTVISCFNRYNSKKTEKTNDTTGLNIMTLDEVAEALGAYTVVDKKLVLREKK